MVQLETSENSVRGRAHVAKSWALPTTVPTCAHSHALGNEPQQSPRQSLFPPLGKLFTGPQTFQCGTPCAREEGPAAWTPAVRRTAPPWGQGSRGKRWAPSSAVVLVSVVCLAAFTRRDLLAVDLFSLLSTGIQRGWRLDEDRRVLDISRWLF